MDFISLPGKGETIPMCDGNCYYCANGNCDAICTDGLCSCNALCHK